MKTVQILEADDIIDPEDWCRPLSLTTMNGGHSDYYSFESCYTGAPENNVKWVKVKYILGIASRGDKTVKELDKVLGQYVKYEFVRGDIPQRQRLSLRDYNITDYTKVFYREHDDDDDIPF
jgi:hypothetical protein